jgi:hypothetical protein
MKKWIKRIAIVVIVILAIPVITVAYWMKGPNRSYRIDYIIDGGVSPNDEPLLVGAAMRDITPPFEEYESWTDVNGDSRFNPEDGDTYEDANANGRPDLVWLGGFAGNRPATGVHDQLWTRVIAMKYGGATIAIVSIDSVGITHEQFIAIRKSLDPKLGLVHVMFSTTHTHSGPDTMGIWSNSNDLPGLLMGTHFDDTNMERIRLLTRAAIEEAVRNLEPAEMVCAQANIEPEGFVRDSREPQVPDRLVTMARFVRQWTDETIATMVSWGNHPEVLNDDNTLITSDFPHYLREGVEYGVPNPNGAEAFGGMCMYLQGACGGLMTPLNIEVPHRDGEQAFKESDFAKSQALGENLALLTLNTLRGETAWKEENPRIGVAAKTIYAPLGGVFKYAIMLGAIHPGYFWGKARTEVNVIRIGDLEILAVPGEIYPEIIDGGVEQPDGADFGIAPIETPGLRTLMQGKVNMVVGLANDEIGYIVPKSQWDVEAPFAYEREKAQYGEENSGGPETAPVVYRELVELMERLHDHLE